ncbi:MAG: DtxR family transcriptional regulator, Mn-dependent transcriptional regulator [Actinomycetota bacterium]|jgi:DtxR family Mn-dependent transcriptional regulator|nr:DtxR family transcriptional regulator, Mn-dependent transcriptional regulator [Actinomycetota bacterium]
MSDGFHPPLEEYLEAIWELEEEGVQVIQARLAEHLGHSAPSVSEMVRRLRTDGYVALDGRALSLTDKGRIRAVSVVRKHRLAERLLTDVIGIPWHKTHEEACRWEHVISDMVEERLVELLGNPATCPHGNPIPGSGGPARQLSALADSQPGDHIRLERVTEQVEVDMEALVYLDDHGFVPGAGAEVRSKAPDGTLTLSLDEGTIALGPRLASQLFVAKV